MIRQLQQQNYFFGAGEEATAIRQQLNHWSCMMPTQVPFLSSCSPPVIPECKIWSKSWASQSAKPRKTKQKKKHLKKINKPWTIANQSPKKPCGLFINIKYKLTAGIPERRKGREILYRHSTEIGSSDASCWESTAASKYNPLELAKNALIKKLEAEQQK